MEEKKRRRPLCLVCGETFPAADLHSLRRTPEEGKRYTKRSKTRSRGSVAHTWFRSDAVGQPALIDSPIGHRPGAVIREAPQTRPATS